LQKQAALFVSDNSWRDIAAQANAGGASMTTRSGRLHSNLRTLAAAASLAVLGLTAAGVRDQAQAEPTVAIAQGTLTGVDKDGVTAFLGVRYALPPQRWRPPLAAPASAAKVDATKFGNDCAQGTSPWGSPSTSEDCLVLNIYAPTDPSGLHFWQNLPVMVWLHGGGFTGGAGRACDPTQIVKEGNVVVVTVNYRLGALGQFAHPAIDGEGHLAGNYNLMDQQLAFKWLRDNIAAFGGNPSNITIFGESAGGIAIYSQLVSPLATGLFQKAIIESGAPADIPLAAAEEQGQTLAEKLGCKDGEPERIASCLRHAPIDAILKNQATAIATIIDGKLVPQAATEALAKGEFNRVPLINGTNHDEGNLIAAFFFDLSGKPLEASGYEGALGVIGGFIPKVDYPASDVPQVMDAYKLADYQVPGLAAAQVITDGVIACPANEMNVLIAAHSPTWQYEFADQDAPDIVGGPISFPYRAAHFSELQYLFDMSAITREGSKTLSPEQKDLSAQMIRYWTNFAWNGDPNGKDSPQWAKIGADGAPVQSLNTPAPASVTDFRASHKCDFWRKLRS
jgi:para-nitrobenzyl esterase